MSLIMAHQRRGLTKDITINDAAGDPITPGANDILRVVIGREREIASDLSGAKLTVTSEAATANGSSFTKGGGSAAYVNRLRLDASDLTFPAGIYSFYVDYMDNADAQEWKCVDRQIMVLRQS